MFVNAGADKNAFECNHNHGNFKKEVFSIVCDALCLLVYLCFVCTSFLFV